MFSGPGGGGQRAGRGWLQGAGPPELPMSLLSRRPGAGAERPQHPAEAAGARAQRPALARAPRRRRAATRGRRARALRGAAGPGAALAHPAAAAEAEPHQPHPETARPGPGGDPAGARVQVPRTPAPGVGAGSRVLVGTTEPSGGRGGRPALWDRAQAETHAAGRTLEPVCLPLGWREEASRGSGWAGLCFSRLESEKGHHPL